MFLGIDIGTSGVKAVLLGANGHVIAQASSALTVQRPHPLWSEQDPADWWNATQAAVLALPADLRARVEAVGLAGQMHGATLLGADDRPLRPATPWNECRSHAAWAPPEAAGAAARAAVRPNGTPGPAARPGAIGGPPPAAAPPTPHPAPARTPPPPAPPAPRPRRARPAP
ncbi:MAG: hypothetical protein IBJ05_00510, partial [Blastomonas sp.]|nr:hypothetical protein [Blastomonas sp.]